MDRKDRLGDLLALRERAEASRYFAAQQREQTKRAAGPPPAAEALPEEGHCPRCGLHVVPSQLASLSLHECPRCGGRWLDRGATLAFPGVMHQPCARYFESFFRAH